MAAVVGTGCATAQTGSPSGVVTDAATVSGRVVSDTSGTIEYWAQYGPTTKYGSESDHKTVAAAKAQLVDVSVTIDGLQRGTTYHYRMCASDASQKGGPGCGSDRRVTTQSVDCGDTVTTDVRLTGDLICPQQPGLVIGADGVDVNLAGHRMDGEISVGGGGPRGIDNTGGYDDVTVRNGTIDLFGTGIETAGASRNRLVNLTVFAAGGAVVIGGGADNEIHRSNVSARGAGITVSSDRPVIADSVADGVFGDGISVAGDFARIVRNRTAHSGGPVVLTSGLEYTGSGARIADNHIDGHWIGGNIVLHGTSNVVVDNEASGGVRPVTDPQFESTGDGFFVDSSSTGTVLRRNTATDNEGDGFDVNAAGVRIGDSSAVDNGLFGIDAVAGVIDLGGNSASGNGNALQCRNVFCQ